jgi:ATP-dependent RNA helicase DDX47/RRP3
MRPTGCLTSTLDRSFDKLLKVIPKERNTFLFSATLSTKVEKLKRASLNKPVQVKVAAK